MTPDAFVYQTLLESGIPGTKVAYPEGNAPPLPWFVYLKRRGGDLFADNVNHAKLQRYRVELLQASNDPDVQARLEAAIAKIGPYTSYETWVPTERCVMTTYDFTYHFEQE